MKRLREIEITGDVARVPLPKGYVAVIDAKDIGLVQHWNWSASVARRPDGSIRSVYAYRRDASGVIYMHRAVVGPEVGLVCDHLDGDGLNNRRGDLRSASQEQNAFNRRRGLNNTSGHKGVSLHKKSGKWQAKISCNRKMRHLGLFQCRTAAALAYAKASMILHMEFGRVA